MSVGKHLRKISEEDSAVDSIARLLNAECEYPLFSDIHLHVDINQDLREISKSIDGKLMTLSAFMERLSLRFDDRQSSLDERF